MTSDNDSAETRSLLRVADWPDSGNKVLLAVAAIIIGAAVGLAGIYEFAHNERARDLRNWQTRLGILADGRADAVNGWVEAQFAALERLAENRALQIYMTELAESPDAASRSDELAAQADYLQTLLTVSAERDGFADPGVDPTVGANVSRAGTAGLALIGRDGTIIAATPGMPPLEGRLAPFVRQAPPGTRSVLDAAPDSGGRLAMGFSVPVFAVQGDRSPSRQIGRVVGVRRIGAELFPLLSQRGSVWRSTEALLVRRKGAAVEYLSPTGRGRELGRSYDLTTPELAASWALDAPGGFAVRRDYENTRVLVTARALSSVPWTLVYKIDRDEALAESEGWIARITGGFILILALFALALFAAWRHGSSRRASALAEEFAALAERFEGQGELLQLVTDSQPNAIYITDREHRYLFANAYAAEQAGVDPDDMIGKTMAAVLGPAEARRIEDGNIQALLTGEPVTRVTRTEDVGDLRVIQSSHIPLTPGREMPDGVLVVEEDVTEAVLERERRERTQRELVATLVRMVDRRDPYSANHSEHVAKVARAIAEEMGLDPITIETVEFAGLLTNVGKMLVPSELLTRPGGLNDHEMRMVHDCLREGIDLLDGVDFEGPVVDTLRQLGERWDGDGEPDGLRGDEILMTARIVAVANAFVVMVSGRAWREKASFDEAVGKLMAESGNAFDHRVVAALINRLDNHGAAEDWTGFARTGTD